jgi:hypothetical protein
MITTLGAILAGLLMPLGQGGVVFSTGHDISPKYNRTDYESPCGSDIFRVRFRNGPDEHGRVDHVTINGRGVPGAAEMLDIRAARRVISRIGIMNCGTDPMKPEFRGIISLSEAESRAASMRPALAFRITRQGDGGWRLTMDD